MDGFWLGLLAGPVGILAALAFMHHLGVLQGGIERFFDGAGLRSRRSLRQRKSNVEKLLRHMNALELSVQWQNGCNPVVDDLQQVPVRDAHRFVNELLEQLDEAEARLARLRAIAEEIAGETTSLVPHSMNGGKAYAGRTMPKARVVMPEVDSIPFDRQSTQSKTPFADQAKWWMIWVDGQPQKTAARDLDAQVQRGKSPAELEAITWDTWEDMIHASKQRSR